MSRTIHVGFSLFPVEELRLAAIPLFESGLVGAIEWTIDCGWDIAQPAWVTALLDAYAAEDRLYGHGVSLSPTSARAGAAETTWLSRLSDELATRRYRHVTEHWGFSRAGGLARGAPLPLVSSDATVECAIRSLHAFAAAARVPVGLENLALALGPDDLESQPAMLARVLDEIDGLLLLDLHNVWCQAMNHERDVRDLVIRYPLARVRQLHISGGSWSGAGRRFRRDTHDALAPAELMELVAWVIPRCPALEVVILERLPHTLHDEPARRAWREEWLALANVVHCAARDPLVFSPPPPTSLLDRAASLDDLARFQDAVVAVLLTAGDGRDALARLLAHPDAAPFRRQVSRFEPRALAVAIDLVHRWGVRSADIEGATPP